MEVPRYTDETGKIVSHFDTLSSALPPSDHEWVGDWKLIVELQSKQTDSNGWSYGINFSNLSRGTYVQIKEDFISFFLYFYFCDQWNSDPSSIVSYFPLETVRTIYYI